MDQQAGTADRTAAREDDADCEASRPLVMGMDRVSSEISMLEDAVAMLEHRLSPMLRPDDGGMPAGDTDQAMPHCSRLTTLAGEQSARLETLRYRVALLTDLSEI